MQRNFFVLLTSVSDNLGLSFSSSSGRVASVKVNANVFEVSWETCEKLLNVCLRELKGLSPLQYYESPVYLNVRYRPTKTDESAFYWLNDPTIQWSTRATEEDNESFQKVIRNITDWFREIEREQSKVELLTSNQHWKTLVPTISSSP